MDFVDDLGPVVERRGFRAMRLFVVRKLIGTGTGHQARSPAKRESVSACLTTREGIRRFALGHQPSFTPFCLAIAYLTLRKGQLGGDQMLTVYNCVVNAHDLRLVVLAAAVCLLASFTAV